MAHVGKLPPVKRYITTHNDEGKAVYSTEVSETSEMKPLPDNLGFALSYLTTTFPVSLTSSSDIKAYTPYLTHPPGLSLSTGTILRHVDFPPATTHAMHRTVSLDYGICLEGEMENVLDSGEVRRLKRGDVVVQRGTMHAWRNPSETEWGRMVFVLQPCERVVVPGGELGEELGTAVGIPESK